MMRRMNPVWIAQMASRLAGVLCASALCLVPSASQALPYTVTAEFVGASPTAPSQDFSVRLYVSGTPANHMLGYSVAVYYDSTTCTLVSATNNTDSPTAGVGLDNTFADTTNDDGNPDTNMIGIVQAAESGVVGWSVPGNAALLNFTTTAAFNPLTSKIHINVRDNDYVENNFFFDADYVTYDYGTGWVFTDSLPVTVSAFSIE